MAKIKGYRSRFVVVVVVVVFFLNFNDFQTPMQGICHYFGRLPCLERNDKNKLFLLIRFVIGAGHPFLMWPLLKLQQSPVSGGSIFTTR